MEEKKKIDDITSRDVDFAKWYTDIVKKAELCDYTSVKGCMVIRPYGFSIWENIQKNLDAKFKEKNVYNCAMPMFIPESLLQKEKDHVEGFAPEVAWVTHGGNEKLEERLCVRPTSETLFCDYYKNIIHSHRDLPQLLNQWVSVVRWEKTTRPFLRSREFYWQEGHTAHKSEEEAKDFTIQMLNVYEDFCKKYLAIPTIKGYKTNKEKFAGAKETTTIESLMHDGKALQSATSHNFGDGFAKAFNIQYLDENNNLQFVHQTSWGFSTRIIGAIIMVHGDDNGLILPPKIAPIQVEIIPIKLKDENVVRKSEEINKLLKKENIRSEIDLTDKTPGFKFANSEMRGIPIRLEIGPRDLEEESCILVRRDTNEKIKVKLENVSKEIINLLDTIHNDMYDKANKHLKSHIFSANTMDEIIEIIEKNGGFVKSLWCGDEACETNLKNKSGISSRCIPFEEEEIEGVCAICGKKANKKVYWGRAY